MLAHRLATLKPHWVDITFLIEFQLFAQKAHKEKKESASPWFPTRGGCIPDVILKMRPEMLISMSRGVSLRVKYNTSLPGYTTCIWRLG